MKGCCEHSQLAHGKFVLVEVGLCGLPPQLDLGKEMQCSDLRSVEDVLFWVYVVAGPDLAVISLLVEFLFERDFK